jgi:hypothetical protein
MLKVHWIASGKKIQFFLAAFEYCIMIAHDFTFGCQAGIEESLVAFSSSLKRGNFLPFSLKTFSFLFI